MLVLAAVSLSNALGEVEGAFEDRSQVDLEISYGGSQMLAQQIASGAPADVFIAAGEFPMDFLADRGLIDTQRFNLLANRLVVAVRREDDLQIDSLMRLNTPLMRRIAVADPQLAPAGRYWRDSLTRLGLWNDIKPKLVFGADVRAALAFLESGNVDAALVYATDARASNVVRVLDIVPPDSYSSIGYPVAVVLSSRSKEDAVEFLDFLRAPLAQQIFLRHGFEPLE